MNKILHALTVQRGDGFKPLKNKAGDFIYKESERPANSRLSPKEVEQGENLLIGFVVFVMTIVATLLASLFSGFLAALTLVLGMWLVNKSLGVFTFVLCVLWAVF